jgi:UDP-glucose 4-epimerase
MNILILGSEGFIGRHLVSYFISEGYKLYGCDLYDAPTQQYNYRKTSRLSPEWEELISESEVDVCINAAGNGSVPYSNAHPANDFESNSVDTMRILDCIRKYRPACKYLHISSAAVYGNPRILPVKEDAVKKPLSPYGWHKLIAENLCQEFSDIYGIRTAIVRPFSVYGPGLKKQLFWDVFQKSLSNKGKIELWGTGNESRDFIYIDDLVKSFHKIILGSPMNGEVYNIASGKETTIKEVVGLFLGYFEEPCMVNFNQHTREGDPVNWQADIHHISQLGFQPAVSLKEGLKETAGWMKSLPIIQ